METKYESLYKGLQTLLEEDQIVIQKEKIQEITATLIPFQTHPTILVYPKRQEEVQSIVRLANQYNVPIWTVSTGKNWGYGEKVATYNGGVTIVLEKLNTIHHVDEALAYAILEPGVTYEQLNTYLKEHHPKLWPDSAGSTKSASVIGNALDKGRGLTPYADHFGNITGLNVVLPNGEMLKTGIGAVKDSSVRHLYKWGTGPYLDGLFAQSNYGIVVQAGVWLMPEPESFDWGVFEFTDNEKEFPRFINELRTLCLHRYLPSFPHIANDFAMLCIVDQYPHDKVLAPSKMLSQKEILSWRKRQGVASWTFGFGLYGSKEMVRFQRNKLRKVLSPFGTIQFIGVAIREDVVGTIARFVAPMVNRLMGKSESFMTSLLPSIHLFQGIPTDHFVKQVYVKKEKKPEGNFDPAEDKCGTLWYGPLVPFDGEIVMQVITKARKIFEEYEFEFFAEVMVENERSLIVLMGVFFDRDNEEDTKRARAWYEHIYTLFEQDGYFPYRATTFAMPKMLEADHVLKSFLENVKNSIDPNHTLAPGKYGITNRNDTNL